MSLLSSVTRLARGPQGRKLMGRAQRYASSPEGQRRVREMRQRLKNRRSTGA